MCEMSMFVLVYVNVCNVFHCVWRYQCVQMLSMNVHVSVCVCERECV